MAACMWNLSGFLLPTIQYRWPFKGSSMFIISKDEGVQGFCLGNKRFVQFPISRVEGVQDFCLGKERGLTLHRVEFLMMAGRSLDYQRR